MKGDFTRFSHQPEEHYAGVLMQQGRVTIDADWNEQFDIEDHRWRFQTIDTIGRACAPEDNAGFALSFTPDGQDLVIGPGRIYIDGILVELLEGSAVRVISAEGKTLEVTDLSPDGRPFEAGQWIELVSDETESLGGPRRIEDVATVTSGDPGVAPALTITINSNAPALDGETNVRLRRIVTYLTQPFYPADAGPEFADSFHPQQWSSQTHLAYLDVWRRHVTAIEDPDIREVALGGPDTATRVQTVWALRLLRDPNPASKGEPADASKIACHDPHPFWDALTLPSAGRLSARAEAAPDEDDPCAVQPGAGYRGLENRLYRVEIHEPGDLGTATFKWSRDNGSILSSIVDFSAPGEVEVRSLGKDRVLRFKAGDRVEAFSEVSELAGFPGTMASITAPPDDADRTISLNPDVSVYDGHPVARLRMWDHKTSEPKTVDKWIELEHGVQVLFGAGPFHVGDYWVIPARVATGDVEGFVEAAPRGIHHHFARVALVTWPAAAGGGGNILDCRQTFPPLCEITRGDGDHCCTVSVGVDGDFLTLQEAVNSLANMAGPARICVLPGEHRFVGPTIISRDDLTISGCGRMSRLVATAGSAIVIKGSFEVRIEDLWLHSASTEPTIRAMSARRLELIDCRITNFGRTDDTDSVDSIHMVGIRNRLALGPGLRVDDGISIVVRNNVFQAAPAASVSAEGFWFEHNLGAGGGVHVREGSELVSIRDNTLVGGRAQGVLIGGLEGDEKRRDDRAGVTKVAVVSNQIEQMGREGIGPDLDFRSEVDGLVIAENQIRECGLDPINDGTTAIGGGILLTNTNDVQVRGNIIARNGPPESSAAIAIGFGLAVISSIGLTVANNTIADNGPTHFKGRFGVNVGLIGFGVVGTRHESDNAAVGPPAAAVSDNTIIAHGGPAVVLAGIGQMSVNDNNLASSYDQPSVLGFGRAVLIANLAAAPDIGRAVANSRLHHGPVQLNHNQITVQTEPQGLAPLGDELDADDASPAELIAGSAVAVLTFDDLLLSSNQILNEIAGGSTPRVGASVWAGALTVRSTENRLSEVVGSALLSYFGDGMAHTVAKNMTTHCIRAEGSNVIERDNIEFMCGRPNSAVLGRFHRWEG